jgi:hypothetical protein
MQAMFLKIAKDRLCGAAAGEGSAEAWQLEDDGMVARCV